MKNGSLGIRGLNLTAVYSPLKCILITVTSALTLKKRSKSICFSIKPPRPLFKKKGRKEEGSFKRAVCRFCLITDLVRKIGVSDLVIFVKLSNGKLGCSQWQNGTTVRRRNHRERGSCPHCQTHQLACLPSQIQDWWSDSGLPLSNSLPVLY